MKFPTLLQNDAERRRTLPTPFKPALDTRHMVATLGLLDPPPTERVGTSLGQRPGELGIRLDL
jgi:hypothetical protein